MWWSRYPVTYIQLMPLSALNSRMTKWTSCISDACLFPWAVCCSKKNFKGFASKNLTDPWAHWNVNNEDIFNSSKLSPQNKMLYHLVQNSNFCLQDLLLLQKSWVCSFFPLLSMSLHTYSLYAKGKKFRSSCVKSFPATAGL